MLCDTVDDNDMNMRVFFYLLLGIFVAAKAGMAAEQDQLSVYFVDVGQGNATFLHQPGKCSLLIDAGPLEQGESLLSVFEEAAVEKLDYVVITRPHPDDYDGLQIILSGIGVDELSDSGDQGLDTAGFEYYRQLRSDLPYSVVTAGDTWQCGDIHIDVLHPPAAFAGNRDVDTRALVLRASYNSFRLLLLGNLSGFGEQSLLATDTDLQAMVLQVGHQGDVEAVSAELLARVQPQVAIVSLGAENTGKDRSIEVLDRLAEKNIHTFRTDLNGTTLLRVAEDGNIRLRQ